VTDLSSTDLRCNVGASGSGTSTLALSAGSDFTFTLDTVSISKIPAFARNSIQ
jgi:hypothetical protein